MNRHRVIIILSAAYFVLQMSLLACWQSMARPELRLVNTLVALAMAVALALINWYSTRYLLQALSRSEQVYAQDVSQQLEHSLKSYRTLALREEKRAREIGQAVEAQLAQAREDLASGHAADADRHLRQGLDLASDLQRPACANVAAAAIVAAKTRECEEAGVRLVAQVDLPSELALPEIEVASLLFNLIDNALHECEAIRAEDPNAQPEVTLQGRIQAGQLFVQVENPCRPQAQERVRHSKRPHADALHGWGSDIVRSIARSHGGIAELSSSGETFTARVMIPLQASAHTGA